MTTKYHYEVYEQCEEEGAESRASFDTYKEAEAYKVEVLEGESLYIDKWRTVYPNYTDLPTAKTKQEAFDCLRNRGTLWVEEENEITQYELGDFLADNTEGEEIELNRYHMNKSEEPEPVRLGECVDGDFEAPYTCKICGEELFVGDKIGRVVTGEGEVKPFTDGGYIAMGKRNCIITCVPCGEILSDAVGIARATIVKQRGGGE